ncbi:unnamed protein product, partial [Discosporangium mesarthrocarpum]
QTLIKAVWESRQQVTKVKNEIGTVTEENDQLKVKMSEEMEDIMMSRMRNNLPGGGAKDLDAEMRKKRIAKNAMLAGLDTEEDDLVVTFEGISTGTLAHIYGRFYRWVGKKLPLGADVRTIQVCTAIVKWVREDKVRKEIAILDDDQKHVLVAKTFLVGWDNSLTSTAEVEDLRLSNGMAAANMLAEINQINSLAVRQV